MKLEVNVDDRIVQILGVMRQALRHRASRWAAVGACLGGVAIAHAATKPHEFKSGDAVSAASMNQNFDAAFSAVTALEEGIEARRSGSLIIPASAAAGYGFVRSVHGYFYMGGRSDENGDGFTDVGVAMAPVNLPTGTELERLTCYFYNNSDLPAESDGGEVRRLRGVLHKTDLNDPPQLTGTSVGTVETWPEKRDEVQTFSLNLDEAVQEGVGYLLYLVLDTRGAPLTETYPVNDECPDCRRVLRHYGCRIDYTLP